MRTRLCCLLFAISLCACHRTQKSAEQTSHATVTNPFADDCEVIRAEGEQKAVLVLFGGYPETPDDIKREFGIVELAKTNGISLILMTFNRRLWLEESEKMRLSNLLQKVLRTNELSTDRLYIGGFSSGGNVSLLLANYLQEKGGTIRLKGVFAVDSPVDLLALYKCSQKNIARNFSAISVRESQRTVADFDAHFGKPENGLDKYAQYSPYVSSLGKMENLDALAGVDIRLYTEPDTLWWKTNRGNEYEDMNAYSLKKLSEQLAKKYGPFHVKLVETSDKGRRSNGMRHPHSWSIVDKEELIEWMLGS
ncbi:MAG: hypothetical protein AAFV25_15265 [Bacteroidota bacterium]